MPGIIVSGYRFRWSERPSPALHNLTASQDLCHDNTFHTDPPALNILKPYFLYRPRQLLRRLIREFQVPRPMEVELPWGVSIHINPREAIGNAIWRTGVYEMDTTEAICRLLPHGGTAVDVGANIGYITSLMMARTGKNGRVLAFEPHPKIFQTLHNNIERVKAQRVDIANATAFNVALSNRSGISTLLLNDLVTGVDFTQNEGVSRLGKAEPGQEGIEVKTETLSTVAADLTIDVLKIDVEGHELQVLEGARELIDKGQIRNIIFEDHKGFESDVQGYLQSAGYTIYQLSFELRRPLLLKEGEQDRAIEYQPPNFLATLRPDQTEEAFRHPGWEALKQ